MRGDWRGEQGRDQQAQSAEEKESSLNEDVQVSTLYEYVDTALRLAVCVTMYRPGLITTLGRGIRSKPSVLEVG